MAAYDAIVVGAGPAGSTAGRALAAGGARILLLDRAPLGRDKPCGGGLTPRAYRDLDVPIDDLVAARVPSARLQHASGAQLQVDLGQGAVWMLRRRDLDRRLAEAAAAAGAELHAGEGVREAASDGRGGFEVITSRGDSHRASILLLATGAEAPLRSALGLGPPPTRMAVALELEGAGRCTGLEPGSFLFDYSVPDGYAWIFPKGGWWNAGMLTFRPHLGRELRGRLETFLAAQGLCFDDPRLIADRAPGRRIPLWLRPSAVHRGRLALLGDAAGLPDPLFGEGIAQALASGRLAAACSLEVLAGRASDLAGYSRSLQAAIGRHLWRTRQVARLLYPAPSLALRGLRLVSTARRAAIHVATERFRVAG